MALTKQQFFDTNDFQIKKLDVPDFGEVCIRQLSANENIELSKLLKEEGAVEALLIICFCVCDEQGDRIFSLDDVNALGTKRSNTLLHIAEQASIFNGWKPAVKDETAEDDPAKKNS